jgi:hypothetical protein
MNNRDVFFISLFTFLTVVIWVVADAYHSFVASTIPAPLQRAMAPITPKLDTAIIQNLKKRGEVIKETPLVIPTSESSLSASIASNSPTLVLSPSVTPSFPSPTITLTPTVTPSLFPTLVPSPTP